MKNTDKMFPGWPDCLLRQQTRIINRISSNNNFVIIWSTILVTFRCLPYILANAAFFCIFSVFISLGGCALWVCGEDVADNGKSPRDGIRSDRRRGEPHCGYGVGGYSVDTVWQERGATVWIWCGWIQSGYNAHGVINVQCGQWRGEPQCGYAAHGVICTFRWGCR